MQTKAYFKKSHAHQSVKDYDRKNQGQAILDELREGGYFEHGRVSSGLRVRDDGRVGHS